MPSLSRLSILRTIPTLAFLLVLGACPAFSQSTDVRFPTSVDGNEIVGAIAARDIGDARLTDHFYTFNGLPGDLLITVQSKNLNGDFDVFTAAELRPVLKVTVYAESSTSIAKNIYLRKPESLILRVEARSPNDDEGSYRIRFSGSFEPSNNGPQVTDSAKPTAESDRQPSRTGDRKTTRVSSVGARIEEPPREVAALPTPEPTPSTTPEESTSGAKSSVVRRSRGRRPASRNPAPKPPTSPASKSDSAAKKESTEETAAAEPSKTESPTTSPDKSSSEESKPESKTSSETSPASNKRSSARRPPRSSRAPAHTASGESPPENTQRLLIEVKDGSHIEYLMSTVKRVTVENGVVVIVSRNGHVERVPMAAIVRMSIGP